MSEAANWSSGTRLFDDEYAFMKDRVVDNLYTIKGPAVKAYVWLLVRQEELARNTKGPRLEVTDKDLATGLGLSKTTAQNYRALLRKLKLIEMSQRKKAVKPKTWSLRRRNTQPVLQFVTLGQ